MLYHKFLLLFFLKIKRCCDFPLNLGVSNARKSQRYTLEEFIHSLLSLPKEVSVRVMYEGSGAGGTLVQATRWVYFKPVC